MARFCSSIFFVLITFLLLNSAGAQDSDGFFSKWMQESSRAEASQPHWMAPVFTVTPRLVQQFRYDIGWQVRGNATTTNFGSGRGLEIVPTQHLEFLISALPYISHTTAARDGIGDMAFLVKYRVAADNEEKGNYVVTALLGMTAPTASYSNGALHPVFTPTFGWGKGWNNFDIQCTIGVAVPTGDTDTIGTPLGFNTTFQYRLMKKLWPEFEVNSTFWDNGNNDGKKEVFLSPGIMVGKLHLWRRLGFSFGGGIQIAATEFHRYDHAGVLSVRFPF